MRLGIQAKHVREVIKILGDKNKNIKVDRYKDDDTREFLDFTKLNTVEINAIGDRLEKLADDPATKKRYAPLFRKYGEWSTLLTGDVGGKLIKKLDMIPVAMKSYFKNSDRKWVFKEGKDGMPLPYFLTKVVYEAAHYERGGSYVPATTHIYINAWKQGKKIQRRFQWQANNVGKEGKSVQALLAQKGLHIENDVAVEGYYKAYHRGVALQEQVGLQMEAVGFGMIEGRYAWSDNQIFAMVREGISTKVVIEEEKPTSDTEDPTHVVDTFWEVVPKRVLKKKADAEEEDDDDAPEVVEEEEDDDEKKRIEVPVHPYLRVFDLDKHRYVDIHTASLLDYQWDKTLGEKLVIRQDDKTLIDMMIKQAGKNVDDIIKGKMSGVIVLATGSPGIGKTLTAEVFSEMIEKPLYNVQCSQLGLDVDTIETNLKEILDRASRWGAILLVDEADVYIRRRGDDITQNAIVGVFLRLIEYYRGVLFMTSNRGDEIDDAIISRATAWIQYDLPDKEMLSRIWEVLGKQYGADFSTADIKALTKSFAGISGRTVRNLLKLARMVSDGKPVTPAAIEMVAKYQLVESRQENKDAV